MRTGAIRERRVAEHAIDQAEGLRRLLGRDVVRVITVASGRNGVGKTQVVINLAAALAQHGKRVLILDEQAGRGTAVKSLGLTPRYDLLHVIRGEQRLDDVMMAGPDGVAVVAAGRGVQSLTELTTAEQMALVEAFHGFSDAVDVVLIDAMAGTAGNALGLSLAASEVIVVVSGEASAITDAYALMKVLSRDFARHQFRLLMNKVRDGEAGRAIYANLADASRRFLRIQPDYMGAVPVDERLRQAARLDKPVVSAFPESVSAAAFRGLAETVDAWPYPRDDNARLGGFMQRLIHSSRLAANCLR